MKKQTTPTTHKSSKNQAGSQAQPQNLSQPKNQTKKLATTLGELEDALNKWDSISKERESTEVETGTRDSELISETKKLLSHLKDQIAELDR